MKEPDEAAAVESEDVAIPVNPVEIATAQQPDYVVGYKRPPMHSRFKPGVSGNPSGRAKGTKNLRTLFQNILRRKCPFGMVMASARSPRRKRSCEAWSWGHSRATRGA